jgi:ABC-type dipeptide/oligopeptide/nickel transport system permease component
VQYDRVWQIVVVLLLLAGIGAVAERVANILVDLGYALLGPRMRPA